MNIIKTLSQAIFSVLSPASVGTPPAGQAVIGISDTTKRLFSIDENGVVTTYGATGEYNDFVNGRILTYFQDFLSITVASPFALAAISGGTIVSLSASGSRRGIIQINKSTTANGGYRAMTDLAAIVLTGGQYFEAWIRQNYQTGTTIRIGFHNASTVTAPTAGTYFEIAGGIASGKCTTGGSTSQTGTYAMTLDAWYKLKITVDVAAANVTFEIRDESETVVFSDVISTNIPTEPVGAGFVATESSAVARTGIFLIDTLRMDL